MTSLKTYCKNIFQKRSSKLSKEVTKKEALENIDRLWAKVEGVHFQFNRITPDIKKVDDKLPPSPVKLVDNADNELTASYERIAPEIIVDSESVLLKKELSAFHASLQNSENLMLAPEQITQYQELTEQLNRCYAETKFCVDEATKILKSKKDSLHLQQ